jgi:hypothetical protein
MVTYKESDINLYGKARDKDDLNLPKVYDFVRKAGTGSDVDEVDEVEEKETVVRDDGHVELVNTSWGGEGLLHKTRCTLLLVADYRLARTNS